LKQVNAFLPETTVGRTMAGQFPDKRAKATMSIGGSQWLILVDFNLKNCIHFYYLYEYHLGAQDLGEL
jgi:ADP-glucose pyrophosphorylase